MAPIISDIALRYAGKVNVFRLDIDDDEDLADYLGINAVPTIKVFSGGHSIKTSVGLVGSDKISAVIDGLINKANMSKTAAKTNQSL